MTTDMLARLGPMRAAFDLGPDVDPTALAEETKEAALKREKLARFLAEQADEPVKL